jgi:hypothetical protein
MMKLNTIGKLGLVTLAGAEGFQIYKNLKNSGGVPTSTILKDFFNKKNLVVVVAALVLIYIFGRAKK